MSDHGIRQTGQEPSAVDPDYVHGPKLSRDPHQMAGAPRFTAEVFAVRQNKQCDTGGFSHRHFEDPLVAALRRIDS
jgi:hypothetical protein